MGIPPAHLYVRGLAAHAYAVHATSNSQKGDENLALNHFSADIISRNKGQSIVAHAAYISGTKLRDVYDGKVHDRSYRRDVLHSEMLLPPSAPSAFSERQIFLDELNRAEKRCDAQMARSFKLALPNEISLTEQISLVKEFAMENFAKQGFCVDLAIHAGMFDEHSKPVSIEPVHERRDNPHTHLLVPFRQVDADGFLKKKYRSVDRRAELSALRKDWADRQNRVYERLGLDMRVSHRSLAAQGINREPTRHLGAATIALEQRGVQTDRGDVHRGILARNRELERQKIRKRSRERDRER